MKMIKLITSAFILPVLICCSTENGKGQQKVAQVNQQKAGTLPATIKKADSHDEQEFRKLFKSLTESLKKKNVNNVAPLLNFPFYTSHKEAANGLGAASDAISTTEFNRYKTAIFNADVMRLLPLCKEDNLSEIDDKTDEIYYRSLKKLTDPGSKMYEAYMQYPETNTQAESYFGFVFGKVNGKFKTLSTYAKWPVK